MERGEARRAGEAVHQADAVEQDAARQRAEDEILEARLARPRLVAVERGEDIGGETLQLEADVQRQQVVRADHHAHAERRQHEQHRIFEPRRRRLLEVRQRQHHRHRRPAKDQYFEEGREGVADIEAAEAGRPAGGNDEQVNPGQREDADRDPRQRHEAAVAAEGADHQDDEDTGGEDRLDRGEVDRGGKGGERDHVAEPLAGTTCCGAGTTRCTGAAAWCSRTRMAPTGARSGLRKLSG